MCRLLASGRTRGDGHCRRPQCLTLFLPRAVVVSGTRRPLRRSCVRLRWIRLLDAKRRPVSNRATNPPHDASMGAEAAGGGREGSTSRAAPCPAGRLHIAPRGGPDRADPPVRSTQSVCERIGPRQVAPPALYSWRCRYHRWTVRRVARTCAEHQHPKRQWGTLRRGQSFHPVRDRQNSRWPTVRRRLDAD
jgi:hypothetical protein